VPVPVTATTALSAEVLAELAGVRGPAEAAVLTEAEDADAGCYAVVMHRFATEPAAWTSKIPAVLAALELPQPGPLCPAGAASHAERPGAVTAGRDDGRLFADHAVVPAPSGCPA
jgi:hypothetical protein